MNNNLEKYNIGYVSRVSGILITVKVYENKNSNILIIDGDIIPNVSVGRYIKIPYEYNYIIGIVEGERIEENKYYQEKKYTNENEKIDRYLDIKILGQLCNNKFIKGIVNLPLVYSQVYLLNSIEKEAIHNIAGENGNSLELGHILNDSQEKFNINTNFLASHIGIFGNTGSGKSNTLAKIYTEVFNKYNIKDSQFIFFDFNGEYEKCFNDNIITDISKLKRIYINLGKDKIRFPNEYDIFEEIEIMSRISEATEKTQKPFLERVIKFYKELKELTNEDEIKNIILNNLKKLCILFFENKVVFSNNIENFCDLIDLFCNNKNNNENSNNIEDIKNQFRKLEHHINNNAIYLKNTNNYFHSYTDFVNNFINTYSIYDKLKEYINIDLNNKLNLFQISLNYKYLYELLKDFYKDNYIKPLINRLEKKIDKLSSIIEVNNVKDKIIEIENKDKIIFSLFNLDLEMKKLMPLILIKYYYDSQKEKNKEINSLHIIVDEAHNILSDNSNRENETIKDYRLETFEEIIKEGRKFGSFLTIASQRPSDISPTIISQLHNYFIHRLVNEEDLRLIQKNISFLDKSNQEMIPILPPGACVYTGINANFPLLVQIEKLDDNISPNSETVKLTSIWVKNNIQ